MTNEYKTLRELDVQPGDVVELQGYGRVDVASIGDETMVDYTARGWLLDGGEWRIVSRASDTPKTWGDGGMKLEEGKYYRTADGKKVGPVRIAETHIPDKWALWSFEGKIYEVVGLPREDAFYTEIIAEEVDHYHVFNRSDFRPKPLRDMTEAEIGALVRAHHEGKVIECLDPIKPMQEWEVVAYPAWFPNKAYRVRSEPKRETVTYTWEEDVLAVSSLNRKGTHHITFDLIDGKPDCDSIKMEGL